jgi:opacity protein-like surface antigen/chaperonin cofactor prefoldin
MKTNLLMVLAMSMTFATAYANQHHEDQVLNNDPINVDGYLQERQVTDGELESIRSEIRKQKGEVILNKEKSKGFKELSKTTEKLSETTEEYLDDKKEAQGEIAEYNAKIKCLMEENPGRDCDKYIKNKEVEQEVIVSQAAPAHVTVTEVSQGHDLNNAWEEIKLIPLAGATAYKGQKEDLEASIAAGLRLESNINSRFSIGMGLNYATLKTEDYGGNIYGNAGFGGVYQNFYGNQGREIDFNTMGVDIYGKLFITRGERFRPYVGGGLGYNRATMKYTQNNPLQYTGYNFGDENYRTSYATGRVMVGTEIMITSSVGLTIEGAYAQGFGGGSNSDAKNPATSPDQARLRTLGKDIIEASAMSILGGLVVTF